MKEPRSYDDFVFLPQPAKGRATLYIYDGDEVIAALRFFAPPWNKTGIQPFAYEIDRFIVWSSLSFRYFITIVLSQGCAIFFDKSSSQEVLFARYIYRVQNADLIPEPDAPFTLHQIIQAPEPWWAHHPTMGEDNLLWSLWQNVSLQYSSPFDKYGEIRSDVPIPPWNATIITHPLGVIFSHDRGYWQVSIKVPEETEAAFAYEIYFPPGAGPNTFFLRIACTKEVKVECKVKITTETQAPVLIVLWDNLLKTHQVPQQGTPLGDRFAWEPLGWDKVDFVLSDELQDVVDVAEFVVNFHPLTALIYNAASYAFVLATGRTIFGHKLSREEKFVVGAVSLVSAAFDLYGPVKSALKTLAKRSKIFQNVLEKPVVDAIKNNTPARVIDGLKSASQKELKDLTRTITEVAAGAAKPARLISNVDDLLGKYLKPVVYDEAILNRILSADCRNFKIPELNTGWLKYLGKKSGEFTNVFSWALAQRGRSRYIVILRRELGEHWKDFLFAAREFRNAATVPQRTRDFLEKYFEQTHHYEDFRKLTRKEGLGMVVEVDHIAEKRFFLDKRISGELHPDYFLAIPVPKNALVARQLPAYLVFYVHSQKTAMMKRLIPHGLEGAFSIQDWMDATVAVYKGLGISDNFITKHIFPEFEFLAKHAKPREAVVRRLNPDLSRILRIGKRVKAKPKMAL